MGNTVSTTTTSGTSASSFISGTCPPLPIPTSLYTVISPLVEGTVTETAYPGTVTAYAATAVSTVAQPIDDTSNTITETLAGTTETSFYGPTVEKTSVVFEVTPAETTVTVPTPAGFTPLICEAAYADPYVTSTVSYYTTTTIYPQVTTTVQDTTTNLIYPSTLIFPTVINASSTTTLYLYTSAPTTTITSTRDQSISTVYAACATDSGNVIAHAPPSKYPYLGAAAADPATDTVSTIVSAIDQVDCCALCQAQEGCTGSVFYQDQYVGAYVSTNLINTACQLILRNDTTCNQAQPGGYAQYDGLYAVSHWSNGPCGQFNFTLFEASQQVHIEYGLTD